MDTQIELGLCLLAYTLRNLADRLDVISCKYDFINSNVIISVRNIDVAEAALHRSAGLDGQIRYDADTIIEEEQTT